MGDPHPTGHHHEDQIGAFALLKQNGIPLSPDLSSLTLDAIERGGR
jgi:hypothetical protein